MWPAISSFIYFKLWGWKIEGGIPENLKKYILVVGPHTSNWDFPLGLLVRSIIRVDAKYMGKASLFKPPFGWIFRALGGYPVDRSKNNNYVEAVVDIFDSKEEFAITITPEGTRKRVNELKSGFYYIALGAKVPLIMVIFDYPAKTIRFSEPFYPSGNKEEDFEVIISHFRGVQGKNPENGIFF